MKTCPALAAVAAWILAAGSAVLPAATNTLTTLAEDEVANGNCTLREALLAAIAQEPVDQCAGDIGPDVIVLGVPGAYELDDEDLSPLSGRDLTIRGDPSRPRSAYTIDLGGVQRLLDARAGSALRLENLEVASGYGHPTADGRGGGALALLNAGLTLRDVRISNCVAAVGGAIDIVSGTSLDLERVEFAANQVGPLDAQLQHRGGALRVAWSSSAAVRLVDLRFVDNAIVDLTPNASGLGGALEVEASTAADFELRDLAFEDNRLEVAGLAIGAGLFADLHATGARFVLADSRFAGNDVVAPATAARGTAFSVALGDAAGEIRRVRATGNGAGDAPAQVAFYAGGAMFAVLSDLLVDAGDGAGVFLLTEAGAWLDAGNLTVTGQAGDGVELFASSGTLRLENSIVWGNAAVAGAEIETFGTAPQVALENLVGVDPLFVDPGGGDYRLAAGSPAVDAGEAVFASVGPFDLAHGPRRLGGEIDLGALERGGIFADGFEVGDLVAWRARIP
ncbi:MAG: hypothetical protein U0X73_07865 [Thermoanaerobaculia bacterium]